LPGSARSTFSSITDRLCLFRTPLDHRRSRFRGVLLFFDCTPSPTSHSVLQFVRRTSSEPTYPPRTQTALITQEISSPTRRRQYIRARRPIRVPSIYPRRSSFHARNNLRPPSRLPQIDHTVDSAPIPAARSSLVSRIGSVGKKWGAARKKRASTGPTKVRLQEHYPGQESTPRPPSVASPTSRSGWFFRHGGAAGSGSPPNKPTALPLKHKQSVGRLLSTMGTEPDSPSRSRSKQRIGGFG